MASIPSWLWITVGWLAIAAAAWMIVFGRFRSRRHGRRLCRACGYDMGATPSLMCPECGRIAKGETELSLRRVPKRWRVAGVGLLAVGWVLMQMPAMVAHGWPAGVPRTILARVAPLSHSGWSYGTAASRSQPVRKADGTWTYPKSPPPGVDYSIVSRASDALFNEVWRRFNKNEMSADAGALYLRRLIPISPADKSRVMPPIWCAGERGPILPSFGTDNDPELRAFGTVEPALTAGRTMRVTYGLTIGRTHFVLARDDLPVDVRASRSAMMEVVDSPEISAALAEAAMPRIVVRWSRRQLMLDKQTATPAWSAGPIYFRVHVRLLLSGLEVGHAEIEISPARDGPPDGSLFGQVVWEEGGELAAKDRLDELAFELVGDPSGAAEMYMRRWDFPPRAWGGGVMIPPRRDLLKKQDAGAGAR